MEPLFTYFACQSKYRASDPSNVRVTDIAQGLPRVSTCLDIIFARPLLTLKTGDTGCGCKTLSKTGRTARPYAPAAMVFLFTSIIEFTVPRAPSFCICLLEKGSEGSAYRISFKEKLLGRLKSIEWLESPPRDENKKSQCSCRSHRPHRKCRTQTPHGHVRQEPLITHATKVTSPTPAFVSIKSYINPIIRTLHMRSSHLNTSCRPTKWRPPHSI